MKRRALSLLYSYSLMCAPPVTAAADDSDGVALRKRVPDCLPGLVAWKMRTFVMPPRAPQIRILYVPVDARTSLWAACRGALSLMARHGFTYMNTDKLCVRRKRGSGARCSPSKSNAHTYMSEPGPSREELHRDTATITPKQSCRVRKREMGQVSEKRDKRWPSFAYMSHNFTIHHPHD